MSDKMGDLLAEQLGGEVVQEQPKELQTEVVDLTGGSEPQTESTTESKTSETEEPSQEEPKESQDNIDRSLNNESSDQPTQGDTQAEVIERNKNEFLRFVNEQFNQKFDSIESFNDALSTKKTSFANEQIEKMNNFVSETGRSIADYIRTQAVDYSKMSNEDIMRLSFKQENPELSMDEVNVLIDSKYKIDKDKYSDSEKTLGKIELKKDVAKARKNLIDMQEKYRTPVQNSNQDSPEQEAARESWVSDMSSEVDEVESITFDINDSGEEFTFALSDDHRKDLVDANSNLSDFFNQYINEDGNWDFDRLNTDMFVLRNFQDIIRSVANQYRSKGTEQVVRDIKNPSFNNEPRQKEQQGKDILDQLDEQMNGRRSMWNN
jgi:hypothetical protein|tara:strand:- start:1345 stop:2478 length:1134 start_codon:yes stop_codon:yes gene_type:complete